jgi:hypothetical protein
MLDRERRENREGWKRRESEWSLGRGNPLLH